ncbi:MAG: glycoside hydrolase family 127 protein [Clostridia bacterium]|nr:glycoside hydrolase family 127 protein [Clostridia bacterium]
MQTIGFSCVNIKDGFWKTKQDMLKNTTVDAVYDRFVETFRFDALKCQPSEKYIPHVFWDSDIAKWIEGACYLLAKEKNPDLLAKVESAVDDIIAGADENGYFNSHYLVTEQQDRFKFRNKHELYCAGHLIEAAIAHRDATGSDRFLRAMCKYADYIEKVFKIEKSAGFVTPGHPEIELALVRLYLCTGEKRYFELAAYFIDEHGKHGESVVETASPKYNQDEMPLCDRETIDGHCVRALYLFSAAADVAFMRGDRKLAEACRRVFDNLVNKRMYITGASGSTDMGEAYTIDYHLPNRTAYAETCASYALALFGRRMFCLEHNAKYADAVERVLYNGFLSGVSLDGKAFFYENPLEIDPEFNGYSQATVRNARFPITQRKEVFSCSCCPPNVIRLIASLGDYMYSYDDDVLYVHQYVNSVMECDGMTVEQITEYPKSGSVKLKFDTHGRKLALRIPGWCRNFKIDRAYMLTGGYAVIADASGVVNVEFDMAVTLIRANRRVHSNAGRLAVMRGPVVYCAEGVDNGKDVRNLCIDLDSKFEVKASPFLLPTLHTTAYQQPESDELYAVAKDNWIQTPLTLIPYYAFANRGESEMIVWLLEK